MFFDVARKFDRNGTIFTVDKERTYKRKKKNNNNRTNYIALERRESHVAINAACQAALKCRQSRLVQLIKR